MCGIAGQFSLNPNISLRDRVGELNNSLLAICHRGPDDQSTFVGNRLVMGMRRLSILDLETGMQPIYNEDKTVVVVFNGEIYNYLELKEDLVNRGHRFYTTSDTEVLVHLYEEFGENFSSFLNGMFAYSLWDSKKSILILSRDRVGEKPLYYSIDNNILYFSSEIKGILNCNDIRKEVNKDAINELLSFNYIPYPNTAFKNIYRLEPGTTMVCNGERLYKIKYWEIPNESDNFEAENLQAKVEKLIDESTNIRLRSDVEVGAFLSGGIDSTVISKYIRRNKNEKFKTFSIGFEEEAFSEIEYSKVVSKIYNTDHIYKIVKHEDFLQELIDTIWYCENPHGDVSFTPTYILSALASKYVKVVLTGDGGDEVFGGYDKYLNYRYDEHRTIDENFRSYFDSISVFRPEIKEKVVTDEFLTLVSEIDTFEKVEKKYKDIHRNDFLNKIMYFDTDYLLEGNNLVKPDRMGMAHSIEARYPLLDYRLIELLFSVDSKCKIVDGEKKILLKNILKDEFDEDFIYRKKQMFTVPIGEWFKNKNFRVVIEGIFNSDTFKKRNYFKYDIIMDMLEEHAKGEKNYTRELRLVLVIELWHRIFIDNSFTEKPSIKDII